MAKMSGKTKPSSISSKAKGRSSGGIPKNASKSKPSGSKTKSSK